MWFLIMFTSALIGFYLANANKYFQLGANWLKRKLPITKGKPLNCGFCLSFWLCFATYYYFHISWIDLFMVPLGASVLCFLTELNAIRK